MTGTRNQSYNFNLKPEANLFLKSFTTQQSEKITTARDTNIMTFGKYLPANTFYIYLPFIFVVPGLNLTVMFSGPEYGLMFREITTDQFTQGSETTVNHNY